MDHTLKFKWKKLSLKTFQYILCSLSQQCVSKFNWIFQHAWLYYCNTVLQGLIEFPSVCLAIHFENWIDFSIPHGARSWTRWLIRIAVTKPCFNFRHDDRVISGFRATAVQLCMELHSLSEREKSLFCQGRNSLQVCNRK